MSNPTLLVKGSLVLSNEAKTAKANRESPINFIISWIKKKMPEYGYNKANFNDRILVIRAETGSGKSTILPVEVFRILRNKTTPLTILAALSDARASNLFSISYSLQVLNIKI